MVRRKFKGVHEMSQENRFGIVSVLVGMLTSMVLFLAWDIWSIVLTYKAFGIWMAGLSVLLPGITPLYWFIHLLGNGPVLQGYNVLSFVTLAVGIYSFTAYHLVQNRYFKYPE
jgi:hypothetical protein